MVETPPTIPLTAESVRPVEEVTLSCLGGVFFTPAAVDDDLAGEFFMCWRKFGFNGVIVTPPPGGLAEGTPPTDGFGAMGTGERWTEAAVPPGEKS